MRILSWNVNGIRAIEKKGFLDFLQKESPDILCLQETKCNPEQLTDKLLAPKEYKSYWSSAEKKGYSGVCIYTKEEPVSVKHGFGIEEFDSEGRILILEFKDFDLFNIYYPNGGAANKRVPYKLDFYKAFLDHANKLKKKGKKLIICGDVNTAHNEIDLARPKSNENNTGFLPEERAWITKFIDNGFIDTFRQFNNEPGHYTWWDYKTKARERDVGWRIDYFFITENLLSKLKKAFIMKYILGSDHCPTGIELQ
ncbi:MAG: exodeoxyribonuclease III [Omnitrophica WOR_2 bacterium GWF2_38_59]|nr:MAG: exodeoxyribonuclease III [Omnitrophica WOR_2 bacterium GWF2_38_59]OGX51227.1 MAG: exodeoxyribonuclease III [Omnitrophica WOR_2 bacterium RIFOXYA2_FULL_38_17]OGX54806.1 MAG: exodeoxyribonuclease III [Omnitrophica WOR_2 bacterium RIFOXYA12_FULL_38_10]OGX55348.1 MAG: exodeoxyribonuclease III [Omnitrophica WOR_2 bacterium RIFOXYB2_FULL_38_16]OGX57937.1 MAG: exodeoxyribonuclease III [Omnitrophica WOR_2 bacterium RIFOXYC2_FULL_38_12]HBG60242.1 exodeoxyribonuclease III [Candidatus Omnitrophot